MRSSARAVTMVGALLVVSSAVSGCLGSGGGSAQSGGSTSASREVVITCEVCGSKGDVFQKYRAQLTAAFNARYNGRYHVKSTPYTPANDSDAAQHYQRGAVTGTLPDLFAEQATIIADVARTGKLVDFAPSLKDNGWKATFKADAFTSLTDDGGHVWGIPEGRDAVGIFYNLKLFQRAGIASFPATWADFVADCRRLKAARAIPFAMDGDWVTQLMWSNLIGTMPGGPEFLRSGIKSGDYAGNPIVVRATEMLKQLHADGCVNRDAFSGDYNRAAAPFLDGQAAMIANGPWMVADIQKTKLKVGYAPSPGNGLLVIPGSEGWASGAKDDAHRAAVVAFMRFMTSNTQEYAKARVTGSFWPTAFTPSPAQAKDLEPLSYHLLEQADQVAATYPHAKFATPQEFSDAWINQWPAYVQGKMSTEDFLGALSDAVKRAQ